MLEKAVAIVGMDCRLPGAGSVAEFWENLRQKKSGIVRMSGADKSGMHVAVGYLDRSEYFDYQRFGIGKREACLIDPQHRLFLTCSANVLEYVDKNQAVKTASPARVGVFSSCPMNTYLRHSKQRPDTSLHTLEGLQATLQNDKDYLALRTAYTLNLTGPAVDLQTSCSGSATAVHYACRSLLAQECDVALAGGATVMNPQLRPYSFVEGSIFAEDGHCRPFTKQAKGTVHGNGVAVIALKRLEDALRDGNPVFSVIIASAINNNGAREEAFTAPSITGWREVIESAQQQIDVETIGIVETHGTGTVLGDKVELEALKEVFCNKTKKQGFCNIGTAKSHIGHLEAACGVVNIIKATCSLNQKIITSDMYEGAEKIDVKDTPFYFASQVRDWQVKEGEQRRAAINSSGMGGTNVHFILEEAPPEVAADIGVLTNQVERSSHEDRCWSRPNFEYDERSLGILLKNTEDERVFETLINQDAFPWLKDHVLGGAAIVPATFFVHLLQCAARSIDSKMKWKLQSVQIKEMLKVSTAKTSLRILVSRESTGWQLQIESRGADGWDAVVHASARAVPSTFEIAEIDSLVALLREPQAALNVADIYQQQSGAALYHGTHFQKMRHAVKVNEGVLGVVADFEGQLKTQLNREVCLLDSCLQLFRFVHGQHERREGTGYLLTSFQSIDIGMVPWREQQAIWCLAKRKEGKERKQYITDFTFFAEDGSLLGEISGAQERGVGTLGGVSDTSEGIGSFPPDKREETWNTKQIIEALKEIVGEFGGVVGPSVRPSDTLVALGIDSFTSLEVALELQSRIGVSFDFLQEVKPALSLEDIAQGVAAKLEKAGV